MRSMGFFRRPRTEVMLMSALQSCCKGFSPCTRSRLLGQP